MTTREQPQAPETCPAKGLLKLLSGKWKADIFRLAVDAPLRFNSLLRQIPDTNKQSLAVALRELEEEGILEKVTIAEKPLHIEYYLTKKGQLLIPVFKQLEGLA
ncbi:winged helix-turn-helix transcriptional regulator [Siphonobacter sp.]|uniref:winged helix-turn-helix transcriptional regulator n=1 Tax=Siphonobacter sp. TaxID=1869184 RepID=UPI003B3AC833